MEPSPPSLRSHEELRRDFGIVVRELRAPLICFLRRYTGDEHAACDLAQETLVKAYFAIDQFDDSRPFRPWVFTIAANAGRDFLRKSARDSAAEQGEAEGEEDARFNPDRVLLARERAEALEAAIAALPAGLREPILLHYHLDWPVEAIAKHLKIEAGAVKTRLHRARRWLQEQLSEEYTA